MITQTSGRNTPHGSHRVAVSFNYRVGLFVWVPEFNRPIFEVHATRSELRVERSAIACTLIGICFRALWRV